MQAMKEKVDPHKHDMACLVVLVVVAAGGATCIMCVALFERNITRDPHPKPCCNKITDAISE